MGCANRRGIELLVEHAGGNTCDFDEFVKRAVGGAFSAAWIVGGYPSRGIHPARSHPAPWVPKDLTVALKHFDWLVVQDIFENELTQAASLVLPACAWVERDGCFMNRAGKVQPFERAIRVPDGAKRDGQYLFEIAGYTGLYSGERVRELMGEEIAAFKAASPTVGAPVHQH